jgi:hypothetical protein
LPPASRARDAGTAGSSLMMQPLNAGILFCTLGLSSSEACYASEVLG